MHAFSTANSFNQDLCLVSRLITNTSNVYSYPEFYFPNIYDIKSELPLTYPQQKCDNGYGAIMLNKHREFKFSDIPLETWVTQLWDRHGKTQNTRCVFDMCPLVSKNIASAWKIINWNFSADSLCKLGQSLQYTVSSETRPNLNVKVIVFGGSMTVGNDAIGSCCSSRTSNCDPYYEHLKSPLNNDHWYCFWFGYLSRWFLHFS